ncbi:hypothetical protein ACOSQ3_032940 [Xanthoceras sorbifolium]
MSGFSPAASFKGSLTGGRLISGSLTVEQSLSVDRSNHFCDPREIPNTYVTERSRPSVGVFGSEAAFSPEDSVDFICANTGNFIIYRRCRARKAKLFKVREQMKDLESCLIIQKDMNTYNQIKLEDACTENNELLNRAIDRWLKSKEFMDVVGVEYVRGSTETKFLISKVDPNFDFNKLEEMRAEELAKTASDQPTGDAAEEEALENSLDKADVRDSDDDEVEVVHPFK